MAGESTQVRTISISDPGFSQLRTYVRDSYQQMMQGIGNVDTVQMQKKQVPPRLV